MFDYVKGCTPHKLKGLFTFNYHIHSHVTRSSEVVHIPKGNTTRFGINALRFEGVTLWNKFYSELLHKKKNNLTKSKFKTLLKTNFLNTYVYLTTIYYCCCFYAHTAASNVFNILRYLCY